MWIRVLQDMCISNKNPKQTVTDSCLSHSNRKLNYLSIL